MRVLVLLASAAALAVLGLGASALARRTPSGEGRRESAKRLDEAFAHTANLRSGVGRCGVGIARRPGLPTVFHAEEVAGVTGFAKDETTGLWHLGVDQGARFYADQGKKRPVGHLFVTPLGKSGTRIDARYLAGEYAGTAFRADTKIAADGSGTAEAAGKLPAARYALTGSWDKANVGTWTQRWVDQCTGSEEDVYVTAADGTATLTIRRERGPSLDLTFAPNRSGKGTVIDAKSGLKGTLEWDREGDGVVKWADGATQPFENWKIYA